MRRSRRSLARLGPSRRSFLKASLAGAAGLASSGGAAVAQRSTEPVAAPTSSSLDPWIEIKTAHLLHNARQIRAHISQRPILAVIKNNGYGLGGLNVARALEPLAGIAGFAVVKLQEAVSLREGGIDKPILLMGPLDSRDLAEAVAREITPMVYTAIGDDLDTLAARRGRPVEIQICVDTGIGRVGVPFRQAGSLIRDLSGRSSIRVAGIMTTLVEDAEFDREQLRRFESLCGELQSEGISLGPRHAASTYPLFQHRGSFYDMVRPGMAIYGVYPEPGFRDLRAMELRPAVALKCRVAYIKRLPRGDSAGYGRAYRATSDVWVATLPAGHADGLPRAAARGARVRIGGRVYPIIATVSASHAIVEIGAHRTVEVGDEAVLFDWHDGSRPEDVAAACGSSVYDLLMHLNPLLPRKLV